MCKELDFLNTKIINCYKCKRLVKFREKIANEKTKRFIDEEYWGKPVVGYGDDKARIIILGLAPAAHGGNRTGRVFTGDKSAEFLFRCLHKVKMSNKPSSKNKMDGLILKDVYMTPVLKCVPPNDKPKAEELNNCFPFFTKEINHLVNAKILLALGRIAFDACLKLYNQSKSKNKFVHGKSYSLTDKLKLFACYHPSPRNVNTGRINEDMMIEVLDELKKF
jgi:uracil-DNA glycosylase family 4